MWHSGNVLIVTKWKSRICGVAHAISVKSENALIPKVRKWGSNLVCDSYLLTGEKS